MATEESSSTLPADFEPCPTPLAWQEVAQSFHSSANSRILATEQAEIKVTEFGQGPPLCFFPPMCGSARLFCLTAWLLRDEYRSLIIDPPRFRRLPKPKNLVAESADSISLALEHLCPEGADIYASTFSSQVALQIMHRYPRSIRRALLQTAWAHRELTFVEKRILQLGRWFPGRLKHVPFWKHAQIENHRRWFPPFDETRFGFLLQEAAETMTASFANQLLAASQTDLRPVLSQIQQPVLILHCEGDGRLIAAAEENLEKQMPCIQREEMYHSGHFPYLTHPHRLVKVIRPFFSGANAS